MEGELGKAPGYHLLLMSVCGSPLSAPLTAAADSE